MKNKKRNGEISCEIFDIVSRVNWNMKQVLQMFKDGEIPYEVFVWMVRNKWNVKDGFQFDSYWRCYVQMIMECSLRNKLFII